MSDERFFQQVKSSLHDYQPAVDASVYSGMRRKLWWSNFTKLSFARFNMYYLLLLLGTSSAIVYYNMDGQPGSCGTNAPVTSQDHQQVITQPVAAEPITEMAPVQNTCQPQTDAVTAQNRTNHERPQVRENNVIQDGSVSTNADDQNQSELQPAGEVNVPVVTNTDAPTNQAITESGTTLETTVEPKADATNSKNGKRKLRVPIPKDKNLTEN
ncbi:MAG: hypothetical protein K1X54_11800 [Flavobacteriales bacterium]|nr:hypothetical protein [Flavobacteriales bacterium]